MARSRLQATAVLLAGLTAGCASLTPPLETDTLFEDARFASRPPPPTAEELFALDEPMREYLRTEVAERVRVRGPVRGLYESLRDGVNLGYDTAMTRTAAETFAARSGNCLSLVIMTAAFARELHVPVRYQSVYGEGTWSRSGDIAFYSGHVNLMLHDGQMDRNGGQELVIDFMADAAGPLRKHSRTISEATVEAMYLNNRAAENLAAGDLDGAYGLAKAAVRRDPSFTTAYNTLGLVYAHHGDLVLAERALRRGLSREPGDLNVQSNLANVLAAAGRTEEAAVIRAQLAAAQPYPPFWYLDQGMAALRNGDDGAALELLQKELDRMPYDDQVHFAIAMVKIRLGDLRDASTHLALALENSTTQDRHDIYAAKLAAMRRLQRR